MAGAGWVKGLAQAVTRFCNLCWRVLKWGLACAAASAIGVGVFVWRSLDETVRAQIESRLAEHYAPLGLTVRVKSARFVEGEGIVARGISISGSPDGDPQRALFFVEEMRAGCTLAAEALLAGDVTIDRVQIIRPTLRAERLRDGTWTVSRLWPLPKLCRDPRKRPPPVEIEGGSVHLVDGRATTPVRVSLRHLNLNLKPKASPSSGGDDAACAVVYEVSGETAGDLARRAQWEGHACPHTGQFALAGSIEGIELGPELWASLRVELPSEYQSLSSLRGQGLIQFSISQSAPGRGPIQFDVQTELAQGRLEDPRWPEPITDLRASVSCSNQGLEVKHASARCGSAAVQVALRRTGWAEKSPLALNAKVRNFHVDEKWFRALPAAVHPVWAKFMPVGPVDLDAQLSFDGRAWKRDATATCNGMSFVYHKFPYRVRQATGTLRLADDVLYTDLVAQAGGRPVQIIARTINPGPQFTGWLEVKASEMTLDDEALVCLPEKTGAFVRSLHPRGKFDFFARYEKTDPAASVMRPRVTINLTDAAIRYEHFPYPLENIRGTLNMFDNRWTFDDLRSGTITCRGALTPLAEGNELVLHFTAHDVPLEEPLFAALKPKVQQVWADLRPRGSIDRLDVDIVHRSAEKHLDLTVTGRKWPPSEQTAQTAISIEPVWFPFRMENAYGLVSYRNGRVVMQDVRATHGRTQGSASGTCQFDGAGGFLVRLESLSAERLSLDREFIEALPEGIRKPVGELNVGGAVEARGSLTFSREAGVRQPVVSHWDLTFGLAQNGIDSAVRLENLHGTARLIGWHDPRRGQVCQGELDLDAATYKTFQFTQVRGPFEVLPQQVVFGSRARRIAAPQTPAPITAKIFDGTVSGDCVIMTGEQPGFTLAAQLTGGDLGRYAQEMLPGRQDLSGKVNATAQLWSAGQGAQAVRGQGRIRLRDGDIYELPVMVSMLKMLSVKAPDATAFSSADIDYRLEGEHFYFDRINFHGDAVSLLGKGEMDFQRQINLNFYAIVGRNEVRIPVIRPILSEASRQMMEIRVSGPVDQPRIVSEAFPGARQFLQQVQDDVRRSTEGQDVLGPAREVLRKSASTLK
jgi:hypothetical protein